MPRTRRRPSKPIKARLRRQLRRQLDPGRTGEEGNIPCIKSDDSGNATYFHRPDLSGVPEAVSTALENGRRVYEASIPTDGIDDGSKVHTGSWCWIRGYHVGDGDFRCPALVCAVREYGDETLLLVCFARPRDLKESYWCSLYPETDDYVLSEVFGFYPISCVEEGFEDMPVDGKMELPCADGDTIKVQSDLCFTDVNDHELYECEVEMEPGSTGVKLEHKEVEDADGSDDAPLPLPRPSYRITMLERSILYPDEEDSDDGAEDS